MRQYSYEHWTIISTLFAIILVPLCMVSYYVSPIKIVTQIPLHTLLTVVVLSCGWGIANIIAGLGLYAVGFGMTLGILIGVGMPLGIFIPMLFHGDSMSSGVPAIFSHAGATLASGSLIAIFGVILIAKAGKIRDSAKHIEHSRSLLWLVLLVIAGVLQTGLAMSMVYGQPALSRAFNQAQLCGTLQEIGISTYCIFSGAVINIGFGVYLLMKNKSFGIFKSSPIRDPLLSLVTGLHFLLFSFLLLFGMKALGSLGPSIGFGVYQSTMLIAGQAIGLCSGEWSAVPKAKSRVIWGIAVLLVATILLAASRSFNN